jgi:hypothetical protein
LRRRMNAETPVPRGDILIADVDRIDDRLVDPNKPEIFKRTLRRGAALEDLIDFQELSPLGSRLYAASHRARTSEGMLRVYEIDEASCDTYFRYAIVKGCDSCATTQPVTIASFQQFILDAPMVDTDPGQDVPFNLIDNFTHRETAPSTNTLRDVIQCMLDKGFNEGVPGPRGEQGPPGNDGLQGPRGRGVTEARREIGPVNASLEEISPGDPTSDFRLVVTLPDVTGGPQPSSFNRVVAANFIHEEILRDDNFSERFTNTSADNQQLSGFLIAFEQPVLARTLTNRTVQLVGNIRQEGFLQPVSLVPLQVIPVNFDGNVKDLEVQFLDGYQVAFEVGSILQLDETVKPMFDFGQQNEIAQGVLLRPALEREIDMNTLFEILLNEIKEEEFPRDLMNVDTQELPPMNLLTIVLRGNQILTGEGIELERSLAAIDRRANMPEPGPSGAASGDWVSFLHLMHRLG